MKRAFAFIRELFAPPQFSPGAVGAVIADMEQRQAQRQAEAAQHTADAANPQSEAVAAWNKAVVHHHMRVGAAFFSDWGQV